MSQLHESDERPPLELVAPATTPYGHRGKGAWAARGGPPSLTAATPDLLATISDELLSAVYDHDDVGLVRAARRYLIALIEHLVPWPPSNSVGRNFDGFLADLQHDLLDATRHLVSGVAQNEPTVPRAAGQLAVLTNLYRARSHRNAPRPEAS